MLSTTIVLSGCLAWTAMLFAIAYWGERHGHRLLRAWPVIFALSLGVHCTAWTYYGSAAQGLQSGFALPPTLVGMSLVSLFAVPFLRRLGELVRRHNSATIADLVVARLGDGAGLGAAITFVALVGIVPYIALQLKAVTQALGPLFGSGTGLPRHGLEVSILFAGAMAAFTILFGARHASAVEHNRGIVLALAFESLVKLCALFAVGVYALHLLSRDGNAGIATRAAEIASTLPVPDYLAMIGLGAMAAFTLPHQFHVGVVELRDPSDLRTARWLFPLYLLLIGAPALPLALAGSQAFGGSVPPDLYVVALPIAGGHPWMALLAYIGGLSAATGMMILSSLTLSIMIGNHWMGARVVRGAGGQHDGGDATSDLRPRVLSYRRIGIVVVFAMAWLYSRAMGGIEALADFGLISFSALAQLAPAVLLSAYRPHIAPRAILAGLIAGTLAWAMLVMLPMAVAEPQWPYVPMWDMPAGRRLSIGVALSLLVNVAALVGVSSLARVRTRTAAAGIRTDALHRTAARFLAPELVQSLFCATPHEERLDETTVTRIERELTAVVGAGMARLLVESARRGGSRPLEAMQRAVGDAARTLRFNQQVMEAALENMSQGISVVDAQLRLVAWNRRYESMFGFPPGLLRVGRPVAELTRWALQRMPGTRPTEEALDRRLAFMRQGTPHLSERLFPDDTIIEIRGNPMPGGGYVATFTDVTAFRSAEEALRRSNETLERRVEDRTAKLEQAVGDAERANLAKTRFLTAVGHDLTQPLHAAQLLTDAMSQHLDSRFLLDFLDQIRGALDSTNDLLSGLLDISRLEAGGLVADPRPFALAEVLEPLAREFSVLAAAKGLRLRAVATDAWVNSDPQLLRRILQNFLANAVRYAERGGVLFGVRRDGDGIRIEVHDTGPGIAPEQSTLIFEEFRRGSASAGQGLGLGLAIADRVSGILGAPLALRSVVGRGSVFSVRVPRVQKETRSGAAREANGTIAGTRVLLLDNDAAVLAAAGKVLESWGCEVAVFADWRDDGLEAAAAASGLWLFDYHLGDGGTGVRVWERLSRACGRRPTIILSADTTADTRQAVRDAGLKLLAKPFKPLALRWAINHLLASPKADGQAEPP